MYLIAIGWLYVALMMAVVEAFSSQGSVIGGVFTFIGYGLVPVCLVMYILTSGDRKRARQKAQAQAAADAPAQAEQAAGLPANESSAYQPNAGGHAPAAAQGSSITPVAKEP